MCFRKYLIRVTRLARINTLIVYQVIEFFLPQATLNIEELDRDSCLYDKVHRLYLKFIMIWNESQTCCIFVFHIAG